MPYPFRAYSISIHAPLTGSDSNIKIRLSVVNQFQSTLPSQGATHTSAPLAATEVISIHAPLTGSDGRAGAAHNDRK